jgi:hypothetical protein
MGDLNTGYFQPSQQLLRNGHMDAFGRRWQIPMTFTDAWAELHPGNPDPSTINNDPVRLDYVAGAHILLRPFILGGKMRLLRHD